ncbi:MAG: cytochrome c-type protein [Moraxellaceae bacterium]|jgi:cytochrome c5|nr:cytochrome c-type protein [Moraxellaceae bacterium]
MKKVLFGALFAGLMMAGPVQAAGIGDKYNKSCAACHNSGAAGAPKKGDKAAWAPRLKQGEAVLLKNVKNGIRAMPPKGMCMDCTDADYKALIKFMSN